MGRQMIISEDHNKNTLSFRRELRVRYITGSVLRDEQRRYPKARHGWVII